MQRRAPSRCRSSVGVWPMHQTMVLGRFFGNGAGGLQHLLRGHAAGFSTCPASLLASTSSRILSMPKTRSSMAACLPSRSGRCGTTRTGRTSVPSGCGCTGRPWPRCGEARIHHDHLGAVFLGVQDVQQGHQVRLGRVRADEQHRLGVLHVVVGVRHRAVTPGVRHARHGGGVADARLVVAVVGAPEGDELAQQVGLLVVVFRRSDPYTASGPFPRGSSAGGRRPR